MNDGGDDDDDEMIEDSDRGRDGNEVLAACFLNCDDSSVLTSLEVLVFDWHDDADDSAATDENDALEVTLSAASVDGATIPDLLGLELEKVDNDNGDDDNICGEGGGTDGSEREGGGFGNGSCCCDNDDDDNDDDDDDGWCDNSGGGGKGSDSNDDEDDDKDDNDDEDGGSGDGGGGNDDKDNKEANFCAFKASNALEDGADGCENELQGSESSILRDICDATRVSEEEDKRESIDCTGVGDSGGVENSWADSNDSGEEGSSGERPCSRLAFSRSRWNENFSSNDSSEGREDIEDPNDSHESKPLRPEAIDWGGVIGKFSGYVKGTDWAWEESKGNVVIIEYGFLLGEVKWGTEEDREESGGKLVKDSKDGEGWVPLVWGEGECEIVEEWSSNDDDSLIGSMVLTRDLGAATPIILLGAEQKRKSLCYTF